MCKYLGLMPFWQLHSACVCVINNVVDRYMTQQYF